MVEFPTSGPAAAFYLPSPAGPASFGIKRGEEVQGGRVTGRGARGRPSRQKHHGGGKTKQENRVCFSVLKNRPVLFCAEGKRAVFSCLEDSDLAPYQQRQMAQLATCSDYAVCRGKRGAPEHQLCPCGQRKRENTKHAVLECPLYGELREPLNRAINRPPTGGDLTFSWKKGHI